MRSSPTNGITPDNISKAITDKEHDEVVAFLDIDDGEVRPQGLGRCLGLCAIIGICRVVRLAKER